MYNIEIDLQNKAIPIYPELENLYITPTEETQIFTHENSYGYDIVTVTAGVQKPIVANETLIYSSGVNVNEGVLEL